MRTKLAVAATVLLGAAAPGLAAGFADPAAIDRALAEFTGADIRHQRSLDVELSDARRCGRGAAGRCAR
jgi:hypothetical protein